MTLDISPMQTTASPIALLAGLQGASTADEFAALLDRGPLSEQIGAQGVLTENKATTVAPANLPPLNEATPAPVAAALAIAHADALVATLAPAPAETPAEPKVAAQAQIALPIAARPVARREAPASLPKEEPDEDRPDARQEADDTAPAPPVIMALPETQGTQRPVAAPAVSPEQLDIAPAKRAAAPVKMPEMADRSRLPEKAESESRSPIPAAAPEPTKPVKVEAKPLPVETPSAERPTHIDVPLSTAPQPGSPPKAAPVRASKIAEIALGLADVLPNPMPAMTQKPVPDASAPAPGPVAPAAAPASPADMIVDRQLDLVRNEQWLGELAHDIASTSGDNNHLSFRLMPHQLGRLDVEVTRAHNGLSLAIHTESDSAQAILTAAQPRLADEIRAQGLRLADTQMFSGDARHSHGHDGAPRPAPLIETFTTFTETADVPEPEQRDGRYA